MPPAALRRPLTVTAWIGMSIVCLVLAPLLLGCMKGGTGATVRDPNEPQT